MIPRRGVKLIAREMIGKPSILKNRGLPSTFEALILLLRTLLILVYLINMKYIVSFLLILSTAYAQDVLVETYGQCEALLSTWSLSHKI